MHVYDSSEYNQTGAFFRLVNAMRKAKENQRSFSVFIGAGCSLSAAPNSISTSKILENCLKDNFDPNYQCPNSWESLYRDFVNHIWTPYGKTERQEMLSKYFLELTPTNSYVYLRKLVEAGYITDIVTTNFDMLINTALDGLPHKIQVGHLPMRTINGGTKVNLYKVHGDIESGELRFSPEELNELPDVIVKRIRVVSTNNTLFCGYSGQDQGLMRSLDKDSDYSVYWASPRKPIKDAVYETRYIYEWMTARNSESNFVYGDDLGKFDGLMEQLYAMLIENKVWSSAIPLWGNNTISDTIHLNERVYSIFQHLLDCSDTLRGMHKWTREYPFYSKDYETTLNAYLYYYRDSINLPSGLLQMPENEIEALIMGLTVEIVASTSGINMSPTNYAEELKKAYETTDSKYMPDTSFWQALITVLSSIEKNTPLMESENLSDIGLNMNSNGRMTLTVKNPQLSHVVDTVSLLNVSGLFVPTCENDGNIDQIEKSKIILQKHGHGMHSSDNKLCFQLEGISKTELLDIFNAFFDNLVGYCIDENNTIIGPKVKIITELLEKPTTLPIFSIGDYLGRLSKETTNRFLKLKSAFDIDSDQYVEGGLSDALKEFIVSDKIGMFVVGSSGAGKTKGIQNFIRVNSSSGCLLAVASPKTFSFDNLFGLMVFFDELSEHCSDDTLFEELNQVLLARTQKLVLIIDGLNEIDGGSNTCSRHYQSIINSIDKIQALGISSIKVIVTCRDHAFLDYCELTSLYPSAEICYSMINAHSITPYYQIQPLTIEQQLQFVDLYFEETSQKKIFEVDVKNNAHIQQMFNQPYLIAIAGRYYHSSTKNTKISTMQNIFKFFAEQMLKRLGNSPTTAIAHNIIDAYFDLIIHAERFGRRITPFILLNQASSKTNSKNIATVLKNLCDINLFTNFHGEEYIRFTHDRIEEYFLSEYLYARSNERDILAQVINIANYDPVFYAAITGHFCKLSQQEHFEQLIESCDILYDNSADQLPCILVNCLCYLTENQYIQLFASANNSHLSLNTFFIIILNGLGQAITRSDIEYPQSIFGTFEKLSAIFPRIACHGKYLYYIASRFHLIRKGNILLADKYCCLSLKAQNEDKHLKQLVAFQKAVIQKHKGELDDVIDSLSEIFEYFRHANYWDSATECVLEWGSALRQKTKFEEALHVYKKIDMNHLIKSPPLQTRLHRKIGTIYKNIMQEQLLAFSDDLNNIQLKSTTEDSYRNAQSEFESALKIESGVVDSIEKMMIMEEMAITAIRYSKIEPNQILRAQFLLSDVEKMLALFPVPSIQLIHMRHISNYKEQNGDITDAIEILEQAQVYSQSQADAFRIFEVDYQLARLIEAHKEILPYDKLQKGFKLLKNITARENEKDSKYIKKCVDSFKRLEKFIDKKHP